MLVTTDQAVTLLKDDEVVSIPTETVYGLAAAIHSEIALKKIFEIKKRPFFDPLIVHVDGIDQAKTLLSEWPAIAETLTRQFWPGPLTILLKKNKKISDLITAGLIRVGIRCPRHPAAIEILKKLKVPVAAPSANLFGRTSPTSAQHVESEFSGEVAVVDGGASEVGIESTVLLIDGNEIAILRTGQILAADIEKTLQKSNTPFFWKKSIGRSESPGQMKHHYMPRKPLFWIEGGKPPDLIEKLNIVLDSIPKEVEGVSLEIPSQISTIEELSLPPLAGEAARLLYAELRLLGEGSSDCIVFYYKDFMASPEWEPVLERLRKASSAVIPGRVSP
jgi:L-threonylcarbamoyladenylate synthase